MADFMNELEGLGKVFIWSASEFLFNSVHSWGMVMDDTPLKNLDFWRSVMCCNNIPVKL